MTDKMALAVLARLLLVIREAVDAALVTVASLQGGEVVGEDGAEGLAEDKLRRTFGGGRHPSPAKRGSD